MKRDKSKQELSEEIELLSTMLESLVQLLEEKGVILQSEWEKKVKTQVKI